MFKHSLSLESEWMLVRAGCLCLWWFTQQQASTVVWCLRCQERLYHNSKKKKKRFCILPFH